MCGRLTWNSSRNDNNVRALEGLLDTLTAIGKVAIDGGNRGNVREIGGDTGSVHDIVEREVVNERAGLEEKGQWLSNSTGSSCDNCRRVGSAKMFIIVGLAPARLAVMLACFAIDDGREWTEAGSILSGVRTSLDHICGG